MKNNLKELLDTDYAAAHLSEEEYRELLSSCNKCHQSCDRCGKPAKNATELED